MNKFLGVVIFLVGCAHLPVSPAELKPSPERNPDIHTQEAILPNTSFDQMYKRMKDYSDKCLNTWRENDCGRNCKNMVKYTPTLVMQRNKLTLFLQEKGKTQQFGDTPMNGVYIMMAESFTNGKTQQLTVHGFEGARYGSTTQPTIDWLAGRKNECPKL